MRIRLGPTAKSMALLPAQIFLLAGCASQPTFPKANVVSNSTIGIVNALSPEISNVHLGVTVFNTYKNKIPNDWGLDQKSFAIVKTLLEKNGYRTVAISVPQQDLDSIREEQDYGDADRGGLNSAWAGKYRRLIAENGLTDIIVLREHIEHMVSIGDNNPYHGYGISSTHGKIPSSAHLFTTVLADVIGGDPAHRTVAHCLGWDPIDPSSIPVDDFENIKISDLASSRSAIESLVEKKLRFDLTNS